MDRKLWITLLLAVAVLVVGCAPGALAASDKNRARWASQGISDYRFVLTRNCFCPIRGPVVIEVRDGEVVSIVDQETGRAEIDGFALNEIFGDAATIEALFDIVDEAEGAATLRVSYDEQLGYPTEIYIDFSELMADEEIGYVVHSLEVLK